MSLLEVITKASAETNRPEADLKNPIILNPKPVLLELKPQDHDTKNDLPIKGAIGWNFSKTETEIIELGQGFFKKLETKLKNQTGFNQDEFLKILGSYLATIARKLDSANNITESDTGKLVEKSGLFMGRDVKGLVLEACILLECWEVLESLIVNKLVEHLYFSNLISNLIEKNRPDLIVLCTKHLSDLKAVDVMRILKFFLSLPTTTNIPSLRKEWESQAFLAIQHLKECDPESLLAIEKVKNKSLRKRLTLTKDASLFLMIAYDGFSITELCLHHLLSSRNYDEAILAACVSSLNSSEMICLFRYLKKWLKKYEKFPHVSPCPEASSTLGLTIFDWIPRVEDIALCLGLVLDEHFSTLVLRTEFHEELKSLNETVNLLAAEARLCAMMANLSHALRGNAKGGNLESRTEGA